MNFDASSCFFIQLFILSTLASYNVIILPKITNDEGHLKKKCFHLRLYVTTTHQQPLSTVLE